MKKLLIPLVTLLVAACSPQVYNMYLEVRQSSNSGIDLSRKTMAIVTMETPDSLFNRQSASSMAKVLENDYYGGEELIGLYRIPAADTVSLEQMHNLVMDTEYDVIFVLNSVLGEPMVDQRIPINTSLSVYDSMGGEDKVHRYKGSALLSSADDANTIGARVATRFLSNWKTETFSLYYYDDFSLDLWEKGLTHAINNEYSKAIDVWMELAKAGPEMKSAAASYNIAMAFYLLEDYSMAQRWLDKADALENLGLSAGLHSRIDAHLQK